MILDIIKTLKFYVFKYYVIVKKFLICIIIVVYNNKKKSFKKSLVQNYHDFSNVHSNFYYYFL